MIDYLELLRRCSLLDRPNQQKQLQVLSPYVEVLRENGNSGSVLLVSTWNSRDAEALMAYWTLAKSQRDRSKDFRVGLVDWFGSITEIRDAIGYPGPVLQTPFVVIRNLQSGGEWKGEGFEAREWLLKRATTFATVLS